MKPDYKVFADIIRARVSADELARDFGLDVGRDRRCRCIFCDGERGDTLRLYPGDRGYFCFRCHAHGDVISLYQQITGSGFRQAIQDLNERYGVGLPLSGADPAAMEKARKESEQRKRERAQNEERKRRLYLAYLAVADVVWRLERAKRENAPQSETEPFQPAFVAALRYLDELRDFRDRLFDKLYPMT